MHTRSADDAESPVSTAAADAVAALGPDVSDHRLERPDGRTVAWSESGVPDGRPLLRFPGTPGSRLFLRGDRGPWIDRGLRAITTERPGFGASTRLEGRGFFEHADDVAAILDELRIDAVPVIGASGASPHILAFAERHPDRVTAATIEVGAAPLEPHEALEQVDLNAREYELLEAGRYDEVEQITEDMRRALLADPLAAFAGIMETAPEDDQRIMRDPAWQRGFTIGLTEALRSGSGGWFDEGLALHRDWGIDIERIATDITWWHSDGDRNAPSSAARRLVDRLPNAQFRLWTDGGHLTGYRLEGEILDELLARG